MADVVASPNASLYEELNRRFDQIVRRHTNERTHLARDVARKIVLDIGCPQPSIPSALDKGRISLAIAKAFLVELAISKVSSPALAASLANKEVVSTYGYVQRQERIGLLLTNSREIEILAQRLLDAPQGHGLRSPRVTFTKLSTEELASYQLTE